MGSSVLVRSTAFVNPLAQRDEMAPLAKSLLSRDERSVADHISGERVVISGMSGLYPEARNVKELSDILYNKINPINNENPRWQYEHPEVSQYMGKVPGLKLFDAQFFKVNYRLCNSMNPFTRKLLEQTYQALYDAGVSSEELSGKAVGVYIGSSLSEGEKAALYGESKKKGHGLLGYSKTMFANRISYWLNIKGPSITTDESCCSSTGMLEQAYLAITRGECEAAIVGGTNLCLHPQSSIHYGRAIKLSPDAKTKSFDTEAAGCARSEAINILFLQKAKDALRIYAEIVHVRCKFTSLLRDETGPIYGFYRDPENMASFISNFYEEIQVSPQAVEYVEAFGSAIPEVDKIELKAIEKVYCENRSDPLLVGSVMSNIGYGEAASGISAITKVLLGYHYGKLAGNLHCDSPRKDVAGLRDGRMRIVTDHQTFKRSYTAVNGISMTGVNSHVLLKGHYKPKDLSRYKTNIPHLVLLSGRQESSVNQIFQDLKSRHVDPEELALFHNIHKAKISGHLGRGFIILDTNEKNETVSLCEKHDYFEGTKRPLCFVYSGMGSQWTGMGAQLMKIPIFAAAIDRCQRVLEPKGVDLIHIITSPDKTIFDNILNSFVGIAAIQIGLTDILRELEIFPDMIIGHSVGELGCAYADGCFTAEQMILSAYSRGLVSAQTPLIRGSMAAIGLGYRQILKLCPPEIEVACHNGPDSSTISGPADIMKEFVAQLTAEKIFAKEVPCSNIAYHSRYIAQAGPGLHKYLSEVITAPKARSERWVSTSVPKEKWNDPIAKFSSAEYHTNNLLNPVLFEETSRLIPTNAVVVEIAPHGLLQAILKRSLPSSCKHVPLTRRGHPDNAQFLLQAIGDLYIEGYNPKIQAIYPKVEFPVSTGTPMLSHLVEWAYNEKWNIPLYVSANRKTAAACTHVITIHDDEHVYLKGHVIREKVTYPFAATLVAVWDTLAMILGSPKKQLSVQFRDVHLHCQPVLHERRQLRLHITVQKGTGRFEVLDDDIKVATGFIISIKDNDTSIKEEQEYEEVMKLNSDDIYQLFNARGYNYTGGFRSIYNANIFLSEANLLWQNNWVTFIDGIIQLNALKRSHKSVSQPEFIRKIEIDVKNHLANKTLQVDDATIVLPAKVSVVTNNTKCGGVLIENMKFQDLPPINKKMVALKTLTFVPYVTVDSVDETSALYVFLQTVAENLNKREINICEVVEYKNQENFKNIQEIVHDIPGITINLSQVFRLNITKNPDNVLKDFDLIMVTDLAADNNMCQVLHRALNRDIFLINKETCSNLSNIRSSLLYRSVCSHSFGSNRLELVIWRPSDVTAGTNAVTVFSQADLRTISSQLTTLPPKHRFVILTSYPAFGELKEFVKEWKKNDGRKINLIVFNHDLLDEQCVDQMPFTDLVIHILNQGVWGGEYYLPIQKNITQGKDMALEITRLGDIDSLQWIKATEDNHPGIPVKVHYAGLNDAYIKNILGVAAKENNTDKKLIEYDFSGTTDGKIRVMGIVQEELISARVKARPELLWPVPEDWTLEEAATVPLAYSLAFYCLCMKSRLYYGNSILIHGGAGALGQAIISIALAQGCEVFTTVSNIKKKRFLLKLFPELKEDHIACSRDNSFRDMIKYATKKLGCDIVISCVKGGLRNESLHCCKRFGYVVDTSLILSNEDYNFEMYCLIECIGYKTQQFSSLFEHENAEELKKLQLMVSEGIARGYVRPLTRVVYEPEDASRALHLQAASRHLGRVLLHLEKDVSYTQNKINCSSERLQLLLSDDDIFIMQLAERLISRGARKLELHCFKKSNCLLFKLSSWEKQGVQCTMTYGSTWDEIIFNLLNNKTPKNVEGIFCILNYNAKCENISKCLERMTLSLPNLNWPLKHYAVIDARKDNGEIINLKTRHELFTIIILPSLNKNGTTENKQSFSMNDAVDAVEKALCCKESAILAHGISKPYDNLLHDVADIAEVAIQNETSQEVTLKDLGMDLSKSQSVRAYLRDVHNILMEEREIPLLTTKKILELEERTPKQEVVETEVLKTFYSHIYQDVLLATTEMVFLSTLTTSGALRGNEFDVSETFLCILPGVEGLHVRFHELCERLKMSAFVLQPGLDKPQETIQEIAQRYAKTLLEKTQLKKRFYLLGYESGVLVALEMAAILEDHGLTGTIFCIGGTPDEIQATFEEKLADFKTEESLQIAVASHMFALIKKTDNIKNLEYELKSESTWKGKVSLCVQKIRGHIDYSIQYAQKLIEAAYARIVQVRRYNSELRSLRSHLISIRPWSSASHLKPHSLQNHSQQQVIQYELQSPLCSAAQDLRCAAIVNRHLDNDALEQFEKKNLCETYILDDDLFTTTVYDDEK